MMLLDLAFPEAGAVVGLAIHTSQYSLVITCATLSQVFGCLMNETVVGQRDSNINLHFFLSSKFSQSALYSSPTLRLQNRTLKITGFHMAYISHIPYNSILHPRTQRLHVFVQALTFPFKLAFPAAYWPSQIFKFKN